MKGNHARNKKITILEPIEVDSPFGSSNKYEPLKDGENIWAYYRHASGSEFYAAQANNIKVEVVFEIAWRDDLETNFKIRYKGQDYDISRIDDFEGYKEPLRIYAYKVN